MVTGVQTCALPIYGSGSARSEGSKGLNKKEQRKLAAEAREKQQELRTAVKRAEGAMEQLTTLRSMIDQAMFAPSSADKSLAGLTMTDLMKRRAETESQIAAAERTWLEAGAALEGAAAEG